MAGVNKVILIGNLGQDPETRYTPNGGAVTNVSLATSEQWRDKTTGEPQERTEWHRVVFFNIGNYKLGEIAGQYLKKGAKIYVEGSLKTRKWTDKNGQDRYTTEVVASQMQMLDRREGGSAEFDSGAPRAARPAPAQSGGGFGGGGSSGSGGGYSPSQGGSPSGGYNQPQGGPSAPPSRGMENDIPWADDDIPF